MSRPQDIDINAYDYELPEERIAARPAAARDASRLLVYRAGAIGDDGFRHLPDHLPDGALLLFNNTRVIQARLPFRRPTGARIELFLLEPALPADHQLNLAAPGPVRWSCLVGNVKRWKETWLVRELERPGGAPLRLRARRLDRGTDGHLVELAWDDPSASFAEVLTLAGHTPLPPYIKRPDEPEDRARYQTVYAERDGSVAAPTAGLHFTEEVLGELDRRGVERRTVTLHVGAGTFLPVKSERLGGHDMHSEKVFVPLEVLRTLERAHREGRPIIPVGTTSMRVLESLYWHARAVGTGDRRAAAMEVGQWEPYVHGEARPGHEALAGLIEALVREGRAGVAGQTRLLIAPGYRFALSRGLITNFHQPRSTLILLVAALIGEDWRRVYRYALDRGFRFLSYGDSSLLLP